MKVTIDGDVIDLAAYRQAVPVIPEQPRLTPAAMRLLGTAVGDLAEAMGGALTAVPMIEPVYVGDDKASVAIILTVRVADLNRRAAEDALPVAKADEPWPVVVRAGHDSGDEQ